MYKTEIYERRLQQNPIKQKSTEYSEKQQQFQTHATMK
jgi:hypothetical protein